MSKPRLNTRYLIYGLALLCALGLMYYLRGRTNTTAEHSRGANSERDYPEIRKEGVLRLLTAYGEGGEVQDGKLTGLVYELAKRLHQRTGLQVEVVLENSWERALEELRTGAVDVIARPLAHTVAIDTALFRPFGEATTGPIFLVQRKADSATHVGRQLDLAGRTITLPEASPLRLFLEHLGEEIGDSIRLAVDPHYATEGLAMLVASGKIPYTACSEVDAKRLAEKLPELDCSLPLSYSLRTTWLLRRSSPQLVDSLLSWGVKR